MAFIDLQIDVADALQLAITRGLPTFVLAWVFLPSSLPQEVPPVVISLLSDASLSNQYFHLQVPGRCGYSMAEHLSNRGYFLLLLDHLGTGASSLIPEPKSLTRDIAALANHSAEQAIYAGLREGALDS